MKSAFFCATPYQIIVAINIRYSFNFSNSDIYIMNHFKDANIIYDKLKGTNIFKNVYYIDCLSFTESFSKNKLLNYTQKIISFNMSRNIVLKYLSNNIQKYDQIYYAFPDMILQLITKELYKINKNLEVNLFEPGTGIYSSMLEKPAKLKRLFNVVTGVSKIMNKYERIFLFKPELLPDDINITLIKIPTIKLSDNELIRTINSVFDYTSEVHDIHQNIIFLEQPLHRLDEGLDHIIIDTIDKLNISDLIVKSHPRSTVGLERFKVYDYKSLPWEIICMNNDINDKILISYISTAAISNKIIYNQEPILVFLYEMKELERIYKPDKKITDLVDSIRTLYDDSSRIFTPKSFSELKSLITLLTDKVQR